MYLWLQSEPKTLSQTSLKGMLEDFFYLNIIFQILCIFFTSPSQFLHCTRLGFTASGL